jgi:hypothetical protein
MWSGPDTRAAILTNKYFQKLYNTRGVAAYTLSRHGVHIDKLRKKEIELKKNVLLLLTI